MSRVSTAVADQVQNSTFRFNEGKGLITNAAVVFEKIGDYDAKCGVRLSIQRLDNDWNPTDDEPVEETLGCGSAHKFHPSMASSPSDEEPQDLGDYDDAPEAEGNCINSVDGGKIDKQSKFAIFSKSLEEAGFKPQYLDGYVPHLVGMKALFTQLPLPKGANFTGKTDPTCLVVKDKKIAVFPYEQAKSAAAKGKNGASAPAPAKGKAAATPTPKAAPAPAETGGDEVEEAVVLFLEAEEAVVLFLADLAEKNPGKTMKHAKIKAHSITGLRGNKAAQDLVKDIEWLGNKCTEMGWEVVADDFTPVTD